MTTKRNSKKADADVLSDMIDKQMEETVKNYASGIYQSVTQNSLANTGTKCEDANFNYNITSKIFAPLASVAW
jgi:hypothetical protein